MTTNPTTTSNNFFDPFTWDKMLSLNPLAAELKLQASKKKLPQNQPKPAPEGFIESYHKILSPDFPVFLKKYLELPLLQRLQGIGLLCGTDWTPLYKNRFYYSRLDHSIGVALIIWHFTHDKAQTLAGLLHDVSTPVFSHVSDFRKGDALTQTATEAPNETMIRRDKTLLSLLQQDGLAVDDVVDYHKYPVADNEIPQLSADRLEYMYPSGMALDGSWTLEEIARTYNDIAVLKNEDDEDELGFNTLTIAEEYCRHFCMIGHILQLNENKLTLHFLGQIMNKAVTLGILTEEDFYTKSETQIIGMIEQALATPSELLPEKTLSLPVESLSLSGKRVSLSGLTRQSKNDSLVKQGNDNKMYVNDNKLLCHDFELLRRYYKTFRTMESIEHTDSPLPENEYFCISLKVKQRFINPLVRDGKKVARLSELSSSSRKIIEDFKTYSDTAYGCVKLL